MESEKLQRRIDTMLLAIEQQLRDRPDRETIPEPQPEVKDQLALLRSQGVTVFFWYRSTKQK